MFSGDKSIVISVTTLCLVTSGTLFAETIAGRLATEMNNVTSAYQEAVSSLIKLQADCKESLSPRTFEGVNRILNDMQRRLSRIEPILKDS
jgi:hypothetical protein